MLIQQSRQTKTNKHPASACGGVNRKRTWDKMWKNWKMCWSSMFSVLKLWTWTFGPSSHLSKNEINCELGSVCVLAHAVSTLQWVPVWSCPWCFWHFCSHWPCMCNKWLPTKQLPGFLCQLCHHHLLQCCQHNTLIFINKFKRKIAMTCCKKRWLHLWHQPWCLFPWQQRSRERCDCHWRKEAKLSREVFRQCHIFVCPRWQNVILWNSQCIATNFQPS